MTNFEKGATRESVLNYALETYDTTPDYPWYYLPNYAVLRRSNQKWYGLIMNISKDKLGLSEKENVDILNLRCDPYERSFLLSQDGIFPAYHMNKGSWLTILLDGSVDEKLVFACLDMSYQSLEKKKYKPQNREPMPWIVPANPKFYDVQKAFSENKEIQWKQARGVIEGDIVYLYLTAPISAVLYKCLVTKVNIPYEYKDENLSMTHVMNIKLLQEYEKDAVTIDTIREHGIQSVRGPRKMPYGLEQEFRKYES